MGGKIGLIHCKHLRPEVSAMVPPNGYSNSLPPGQPGAVEAKQQKAANTSTHNTKNSRFSQENPKVAGNGRMELVEAIYRLGVPKL
jgi:hypothetical protein